MLPFIFKGEVMAGKLDHVAISAKDMDWYIQFFKDVFSMEVTKWNDAHTQVWIDDSVQINKGEDKPFVGMDHISIKVDDVDDAIEKANEACRTWIEVELEEDEPVMPYVSDIEDIKDLLRNRPFHTFPPP